MNLFKIVPIFIGIVFVLIISCWIIMGILVYKGSTQISEEGLSSIVHSLWCGKRSDCKVPGVEE